MNFRSIGPGVSVRVPVSIIPKDRRRMYEVRDIIEKREFNRLATNAKVTLADFKALDSWRDVIPEYVKDYVQLNQFM